ncbi:hypothetical protein Tco_0343904 [Tanacetum coccineum]
MVELDSSCTQQGHQQLQLKHSLVDDQAISTQQSCIQESKEYSTTPRNYCISQLYDILEQVEQLGLLVEPCGILYDNMK